MDISASLCLRSASMAGYFSKGEGLGRRVSYFQFAIEYFLRGFDALTALLTNIELVGQTAHGFRALINRLIDGIISNALADTNEHLGFPCKSTTQSTMKLSLI